MNMEEELFASGHNACAGCGAAIAMRLIMKAAGSNTIVTQATGCMEVVSTPYPLTSWRVPYIHSAFENAAATASGIARALKVQKKSANVIAIAGDGGAFDIGLQALSGAIERREKITFICYDNESYANTGVQRSGATQKYADTTTTPAGKIIHGKTEWKKHMPLIIAAHNEDVYVATANIAFPQDFMNKIKKAITHPPAYIQVFTPCVPGWKYPSNMTIEIARLAFKTKITPLYEIENGILKFTMKPQQQVPVREYLKTQGRYSHLTDAEIQDLQKHLNEEYEKLLKLEETKVRI